MRQTAISDFMIAGLCSASGSVRDCGAKAGVAADDSAAFQEAVSRAARADHAVVRTEEPRT
jgi:polygalacturonase